MTNSARNRRPGEMVSYTALFALMLLWVASIPLFGDTAVGRTLLALVYLGMMSVALTISLPPRWPRWWPLLALAIVLLPRIALSQEPTWLATAFELGGVLVAIVIPILLTAHVLGTADVTANTIFGALSAYVFLGFGWTQIYLAIDAFMPGSFSFPTEGPHSAFEYLYFSFISLTTVGYGDITPRAPVARAFAMIEGLIGQIYLAVLVARLVSLHSSRSSPPPSAPTE